MTCSGRCLDMEIAVRAADVQRVQHCDCACVTLGCATAAPAPCDDLEALGYLIVWMMKGRLPWDDCSSQADLIATKQASSDKDLCAGLPRMCAAVVYVYVHVLLN